MTNVFCIDTSGPYCSLAVETNGRVLDDHVRLDRSHSQHVLDRIQALFERASVGPTQLDLIGFGCGPGSFTGVRIAASLTQAMALAAGAQVVPVRSETTLVAQAGAPQASCVAIPSRGDAFYVAFYRGTECQIESQLWSEPPTWLDDSRGSARLLGTCPPWWPEGTQADHSIAPEDASPRARAMLPLVLSAQDRALPPEGALPVYLEEDSPWQPSQPQRVSQ